MPPHCVRGALREGFGSQDFHNEHHLRCETPWYIATTRRGGESGKRLPVSIGTHFLRAKGEAVRLSFARRHNTHFRIGAHKGLEKVELMGWTWGGGSNLVWHTSTPPSFSMSHQPVFGRFFGDIDRRQAITIRSVGGGYWDVGRLMDNDTCGQSRGVVFGPLIARRTMRLSSNLENSARREYHGSHHHFLLYPNY